MRHTVEVAARYFLPVRDDLKWYRWKSHRISTAWQVAFHPSAHAPDARRIHDSHIVTVLFS